MKSTFTSVFVVFAILFNVRASMPESVSDLVETQLKTQDLRLNRLTSRLVGLLDKVNVRPSMDMVKHELSFLRRVEDEGFCENNRVRCGESPQCISPRFFCDDVIDCLNGVDESPSRCVNPMTKNSVWIGYPALDECTPLKANRAVVHVVDVIGNAFFNETVNLKLQMRLESTLNKKVEVMLFSSGTYSKGEQKFTMYPPEPNGVGMEAFFDGVSVDRFTGNIIRNVSGKKCGEFRFTKMVSH